MTERPKTGLREVLTHLLSDDHDCEEPDLPAEAHGRVVAENTTLKQRLRQLTAENRTLDDRLQAARSNARFADKRISELEMLLLESGTGHDGRP